MSEKPTLVIGDVHGHFDRLESLLLQEGIIGPCPDCNGTGDTPFTITFEPEGPVGGASLDRDESEFEIVFEPESEECEACHGDGQRRINHDVRVIQVGDLGHFGDDASPTGDQMCYLYAERWFDNVLWGNHDRAVVDLSHAFRGYMAPNENTKALIRLLMESGKLTMATEAHGYLIVHAGIALNFEGLTNGHDAKSYSDYLNMVAEEKLRIKHPTRPFRAVDNISKARGGRAGEGGCLWMDWDREKHLEGDPFKFICGHSARHDGQVDQDKYGNWNIDIGGKTEARLAGLWLEEGKNPRSVRVDI